MDYLKDLSIDLEDLYLAEEDLLLEDKISLLFLLNNNDRADWTLQNMQNIFRFPNKGTNIFSSIASTLDNRHAKQNLIEGLAIVGAFEILENLGLKISDIKENLAPYDLTKNLFINRNNKIIYTACEAMNSSDCEMFAKHIQDTTNISFDPSIYQIETLIMYLVCEKLLYIGLNSEESDLTILTGFLENQKLNEPLQILKKVPQMKIDSASTSSERFLGEPRISSKSTGNTDSRNCIENDYYIIRKCVVLIINQESFYPDSDPKRKNEISSQTLTERKGTQNDEVELTKLFQSFGYTVIARNNIKDTDMLEEVQKAVDRTAKDKLDGLIVCLLSHGEQGIVYGSNSIPVAISAFKSKLASRDLLGIPKILLIQACQGSTLQRNVDIFDQIEFDSPKSKNDDSPFADMFTFWSTIQGFASIRHIDKVNNYEIKCYLEAINFKFQGTWFIQELVRKIREHHMNKHLFEICTKVISDVSDKRGPGRECMLPTIDSTLRKNFVFFGYRFPLIQQSSTNC